MRLSHDGRSGSSSGSNVENARRCTGWGASRGGTLTCLSCGSSACDRRLECRSRMRREFHVRCCEGEGVRFPSATRRNIYVRSEKAGRRVIQSVTRFIERRLKLQVNAAKSAVDRPWRRSFLSFTLRNEPELRRCIAAKAVARFKHRVRELTGRHRGVSLERMIRELAPYLRGWAGYFGFSQWRELPSLEGWVRRRLRCVAWVQWKTRGRRYR